MCFWCPDSRSLYVCSYTSLERSQCNLTGSPNDSNVLPYLASYFWCWVSWGITWASGHVMNKKFAWFIHCIKLYTLFAIPLYVHEVECWWYCDGDLTCILAIILSGWHTGLPIRLVGSDRIISSELPMRDPLSYNLIALSWKSGATGSTSSWSSINGISFFVLNIHLFPLDKTWITSWSNPITYEVDPFDAFDSKRITSWSNPLIFVCDGSWLSKYVLSLSTAKNFATYMNSQSPWYKIWDMY